MRLKETGDRLREIRVKRNLSLREAAEKVGISHTYLNALERGYEPRTGRPVNPSARTLVLIAKGYGIPAVGFGLALPHGSHKTSTAFTSTPPPPAGARGRRQRGWSPRWRGGAGAGRRCSCALHARPARVLVGPACSSARRARWPACSRARNAPAPGEIGEGKARAPRPRTPQRFDNRFIPARLSMLSVCHRLPSGAAVSGPSRVPPRRFRAAEKVSSHPRRSRPIQRERERHERLHGRL